MDTRLVILALWLTLGASSAFAEPVTLGHFCWQLTPFADTLDLEVIQTPGGLYVLPGALHGADVYTLEGGGTAVTSRSGERAAVTVVLQNPTGFFRENPLCELQAAVLLADLSGVFTLTCQGTPDPAFRLFGSLTPIACVEEPLTFSQLMRTHGTVRLGGE